MTDTLRAVDLSRFCADANDPREYLRSPWKHGEWVYATNGHVCVRVPAASMPEVAECAKAPLAQNLPVLLGLIGIWNRNVLGYPAFALLPYDQRLARLPAAWPRAKSISADR